MISTPVTDTVKRVGADGTVETLDRRTLFAVQTPQTFDCAKLKAAHQRAEDEGSTRPTTRRCLRIIVGAPGDLRALRRTANLRTGGL